MLKRIFQTLAVILLAATGVMAANDFVRTAPDSTGKRIDNESFARGVDTIYRQRVRICGQNDADCVTPSTTPPSGAEPALPVRNIPSGTQPVSQGVGGTGVAPWATAVTTTGDVIVKTGDALNNAQRVSIVSGSIAATAADTVGNTATFNATNVASTVAMAGQQGAVFVLAAGTLNATITPECSPDNTSWTTAVFTDGQAGTPSASLALTNPNPVLILGVMCSTPAGFVRVRASTYGSGSAVGTVRSVAGRPGNVMYGTDGSQLRAPAVMNSNPTGTEYGIVTRNVTGASGGTSINDNTGVVIGTTPGTPSFFMRQDSPGAVTDGRTGFARMNDKRVVLIQATDSGGSDITDTTTHAQRVTQTTVTPGGGQTGPSSVAAIEKCETGFNLAANFTAGQTLELVPLTAGQIPRICGAIIWPETDTNITIVRGTGTNCGTGTVTIAGPFRLATVAGASRPFVIPAGFGAFFFGTSGSAICVTSSVAGNVTAYASGAKF